MLYQGGDISVLRCPHLPTPASYRFPFFLMASWPFLLSLPTPDPEPLHFLPHPFSLLIPPPSKNSGLSGLSTEHSLREYDRICHKPITYHSWTWPSRRRKTIPRTRKRVRHPNCHCWLFHKNTMLHNLKMCRKHGSDSYGLYNCFFSVCEPYMPCLVGSVSHVLLVSSTPMT